MKSQVSKFVCASSALAISLAVLFAPQAVHAGSSVVRGIASTVAITPKPKPVVMKAMDSHGGWDWQSNPQAYRPDGLTDYDGDAAQGIAAVDSNSERKSASLAAYAPKS